MHRKLLELLTKADRIIITTSDGDVITTKEGTEFIFKFSSLCLKTWNSEQDIPYSDIKRITPLVDK